MTVEHKPQTALPWVVEPVKKHGDGYDVMTGSGFRDQIFRTRFKRDADYSTHAANSYPKLVEALSAFLRAPSMGSSGPGSITIEVQSFNREGAIALLKELGETS